MFDFRPLTNTKLSLLSTISLSAVLLLIAFADSFLSNFSLSQSHNIKQIIGSTSAHIQLLSIGEETEDHNENQNHLMPPTQITEEAKTSSFRKKKPGPTNRKEKLDARVREFFGGKCKVQFFMTWISPASSFRRREFFALETLFKSNPSGCLIILSKSMDSPRGYMILKPLIDRGFKVISMAPDLTFLFKNTPAEAWFDEIKRGERDPGEIPLAQNLSNLLRLAVLYKYGGIYLDTDFITLREFSGLRNSIGAQSMDASGNWTRLNNAVLVFDRHHPLLYKFIEEFALTFDGNKWGHNGPYLVSRVVQRVAYNLTILPPMAFYPVDWNRIGGLFKEPRNKWEAKWVRAKLLQLTGEAYGIHLWNKQSSELKIEKGSIIGKVISEHCVVCEDVYGLGKFSSAQR